MTVAVVVILPFKNARKFVHKLKLHSSSEWRKYCKNGNKPENIPTNPWRTYKKEWKGMKDWLGMDEI